jgi:TolA-binding protein
LKQDQEAQELYQRFIADYPRHEDVDAALYQLAWVQRDLGGAAESQATFGRLRRDFAGGRFWADATYRLAESAHAAKDDPQALELLGELLEADPPDSILPHALYLKSQIAAAADHWDDVRATLRELIARFPNSPLRLAADYWLAEAAYRQDQYDEAVERFMALSQRAQGAKEKWLGMVPLRLAQSLAQQKKWDEAQRIAAGIESQFPAFDRQYEVDYLLGRCHASQGEFAEARAAYLKVTRSPTAGKTETAAMAQWMIGESYFHQKDYQAALREYLRLEILYAYPEWQAGALLQAAKCYELLDQSKAATELYVRILKSYPHTAFTEEAAARLRSAASPKTRS